MPPASTSDSLRIQKLEADLAELSIKEARLTFALEGSGDGIWDWNIPAGTVELSSRWKSMLGHTEDEIDNDLSEWSSRVHPEDMPQVMADVQANLDGKTVSFANEHRVRCKDGSYLWVLDRGKVVLRDNEGKPLRMVGTHTDVSEHKITIRAMETVLRDNAALLSALNTHAIVSVANNTGDITEVNDAFCTISGYSRNELLGKNHRIVNSGVQPREFWVSMWRDIASGKPWRGTVCNRAKNGSHYWVDTFIAPFMNVDGVIEKYISIRTDITTAKNQEAALLSSANLLAKAAEAANEANRAKSNFLANMSHELRTPMNAILGMLALLRKTELNSRQADYAVKTEGAARSLLSLLNDILDLSKAEAGKMELDPTAFNLDHLTRDLSVILSTNLTHKPVELVFNIAPNLPRHFMGDAMRLKQVLINLGSNAIKFTERGYVTITITQQSLHDNKQCLQFSVQDSGIGIAPENQAKIFSGFTQAEASTTRRFGGTGLGLTISQRLVALMGGKLELESSIGNGSRFFFSITLPLLNETSIANLEASFNNIAQSAHQSRLQNLRLLLVEDNLNNQQIALELLEAEGAIVSIANHGQEALDILGAHLKSTQTSGFDVVLMDLQMPIMDGLTATQHIRNTLGLVNLPIIAMTANAMTSDKEDCLKAGMNDHIGKPFDLNNLVNLLRKQVNLEAVTHASATLPEVVTTTTITTSTTTSATAALQLAEANGIELTAALYRLGGNQALYLKMLPKFLDSISALPAQLQSNLAQGEFQTASHALHSLKGLAATMGVTLLATEAANGEKLLLNNPSAAEAKVIIEQIANSISRSIPLLQALLAAMQPAPATPSHEKNATETSLSADTKNGHYQALQTTLIALTLQLKNADMRAIKTHEHIQQQFNLVLQNSELTKTVNALNDAINSLDFQRALLLCNELAEQITPRAS